MTLLDIGTNLANKAFRRDLDAVLARAVDAGVEGIVATGTSVVMSRAVHEIATAHHARAPKLWCTAGIHPHHASTFSADAIVELRALAAKPEVVAIGECGLDFDRNFSPRDAQLRCFEAQLELAEELGMPVFLHERAAYEDFAAILARHRSKLAGGVVHCFTGDARSLARYLELDMHVGITGWICDERRGTHLRALVATIPENRLLVETDAPYILPRDMREKPRDGRNEPCFLPHVARVIAECRGQSEAELARATTFAARALFRL